MPFDINGNILNNLHAKLYNSTSIIRNGLICYLDAANAESYNGSGSTWYDLSGNGNNGTLTNGTTFGSNGIVFDGADDYVSVAETSGMTPSVLTLECVFEVLSDTNTVYASGINTLQYIAFRQNTRTSQGAFEGYCVFYNETNRSIDLYTTSSAGVQSITTTPINSMPLNTKIHTTCLLNTTQQSIYINGSLSAGPTNKASGIDYNGTHTLKLGRAVGIDNNFDMAFNGRIYSFKLYNRVLTAAEINQNFNATRGRYGI